MAGQRVFISYRRADSADTVARMHDVLATVFGPESVFRDLDAIGAGIPFDIAVAEAVRRCHVCLAVIGPGWLHARDGGGRARLHLPDDPVHLELATALAHQVAVLPVLIDGAEMPARHELPPGLAELSLHNAVALRAQAFHADLGRLVGLVGDHDPAAFAEPAAPARWDDLVLPDASHEALRQALMQLRYRSQAQALAHPALAEAPAALTVLICGPAGSGKSLAARVLASEAGLDLYRVDLDDVLLRWRTGDRLPIDWLFRRVGASRVAVHLHDTSATTGGEREIAATLMRTLLRHLSRRDGLLVVTRRTMPKEGQGWPRFDQVVRLPEPGYEQRQRLWRRLWHHELPLPPDTTFETLAEMPLSGAEIRQRAAQALLDAVASGRLGH